MPSKRFDRDSLQELALRQSMPSAIPWIIAALGIAGIGVFLLVRPDVGGDRYQSMNPYLGAALIPMGCILAGLMYLRHLQNRSTMLDLDQEGFSYTASGDRHRFPWQEVGEFRLVKGPSARSRLVAFEHRLDETREGDGVVDTDAVEDEPAPRQWSSLMTLPPLAEMDGDDLCRLMNEYRAAAIEQSGDA